MDESTRGLPECVSRLLWETAPGVVSWERDRDFVVERVLTHGTWEAVQWVRSRVGDDGIRAVILRTRGRRLSPPQLRFWQVLLDLPEDLVTGWIRSEARQVWDRRSG